MRKGVLLLLGLTLGTLACQRANPGYHPEGVPSGAGGAATGSAGSTVTGSRRDDRHRGRHGRRRRSGHGRRPPVRPAAEALGRRHRRVDGGAGGRPAAIRSTAAGTPQRHVRGDQDCVTGVGPPCGAWECRTGRCAVVCPNCTDSDGDGYGVGTGLRRPRLRRRRPRGGPAPARARATTGTGGTMNVGVCRAGTQTCAGGVWSACNGQVLPSGEACNGEDDDCNGKRRRRSAARSPAASARARARRAAVHRGQARRLPARGAGGDQRRLRRQSTTTATAPSTRTARRSRASASRPTATTTALTAAAYAIPQRSRRPSTTRRRGPHRPKAVCVAGGATCLDRRTYMSPDGIQAVTMAERRLGLRQLRVDDLDALPARAPRRRIAQPHRHDPAADARRACTFPATVTTPTTLDGVAHRPR